MNKQKVITTLPQTLTFFGGAGAAAATAAAAEHVRVTIYSNKC